MMQTSLLAALLALHAVANPQFFAHHGRRVCGSRDPYHHYHRHVVTATESYILPLHRPYITKCQGHRLCSTYKTVYTVAYRQVSRVAAVSSTYPECCPGWRRFHSLNCNQAVCELTCVNGGTCMAPNQCACTPGWTGHRCQTDVDECLQQHPCAHRCINTAGSFRCACRDGFGLSADGRSCVYLGPTAQDPGDVSASGEQLGIPGNVSEELHSLRSRVELLEKKLQLALAPYSTVFPPSLDEGVSETTLLSHSFQQLDRIDSLSEQIGFLEERLGTCSCQEN